MHKKNEKRYNILNCEVKMKKSKAKIKKVMKGLQKASKTHAAQAKTLKGVLSGRSKNRNR